MYRLGYLLMFLLSPILIACMFVHTMWVGNRRIELVLIVFAIIAIQAVLAPH